MAFNPSEYYGENYNPTQHEPPAKVYVFENFKDVYARTMLYKPESIDLGNKMAWLNYDYPGCVQVAIIEKGNDMDEWDEHWAFFKDHARHTTYGFQVTKIREYEGSDHVPGHMFITRLNSICRNRQGT